MKPRFWPIRQTRPLALLWVLPLLVQMLAATLHSPDNCAPQHAHAHAAHFHQAHSHQAQLDGVSADDDGCLSCRWLLASVAQTVAAGRLIFTSRVSENARNEREFSVVARFRSTHHNRGPPC